MAIWSSILDVFESALRVIHGGLVPVFEQHAWGWAIIALTIVVRLLLTPLAIKQFRNMRAMQSLAPKQKELQKKHKVDRDLLRKDPETYKARRQKLNEEMMALYKEEGVNPASSCLPLLAQAPVFFALYRVLFSMPELREASFYFFTSGGADGLATTVRSAGVAGIALALGMAASMFVMQKQMMGRTPAAEGAMAQQQKIMLYAMPAFLAFISFNLPLGVLIYWVTTNLWQMGQQALILREVQHETADASSDGKAAPAPRSRATGAAASGDGAGRSGKAKGSDRSGKAKGSDRSGKAKGSGSGSGRSNKAKGDAKGGSRPAARKTGSDREETRASDNGSQPGSKRSSHQRGDHIPRRTGR